MDSDVKRLVLLLVCQLSLWLAMDSLEIDECVIAIWHWQQMCNMAVNAMGYRRMLARRPRRIWAHERGMGQPGFFDRNLLGSFNSREFKSRMRIDVSTFEYLCSALGPTLFKQDTNMRPAIPVEVKVAVAISRLATGNSMQTIADLYRIGLSTSQLAVNQFTGAIKSILLKKFIRWPSTSTMEQFAGEFESLHGIPYVVGAVDGSHIPIVAPRFHAPDYYNRKGFHSVLLQGVVSSKCIFWDFDIGWAGSLHDANLWGRTAIGQFCQAGKLSPFALVGDAAYPCRPYMLSPYKGHKDGLSREEYHWNFVQSSTRMCVERAFGMLKGRWRVLLKRIDVNLKNVPELVSTCLVLHNICLIFGDEFWKTEWMREAQEEVHNGLTMGRASRQMAHEREAVANHALEELAGIEDESRDTLEYISQEAAKKFQHSMSTDGKSYKELCARRDGIARSLWQAKTKVAIAEAFPMDV
jgi:hypothetical protein